MQAEKGEGKEKGGGGGEMLVGGFVYPQSLNDVPRAALSIARLMKEMYSEIGEDKPLNNITASSLIVLPSGELALVESEELNILYNTQSSLSSQLDNINESDYERPRWYAPEFKSVGTLTPSSDIFSLGLIIWAMYNKTVPFAHLDSYSANTRISLGLLPELKNIPSELEDVVESMLSNSMY